MLSISPALTGAYLANNHKIAGFEFLLVAILVGPCISGIAEIVNDYSDRETDKQQNVKRIWKFPFSGGSGVVRIGGITKKETIATALLFSAAAFAISLLFNWQVTILTAIGLFIALEYSLGPIHAKIRGVWGTLFFASGYRGIVSFNLGWAAFLPINNHSFTISFLISLFFFSAFVISHLSDYKEDKKLSINTFPVQVGFENAKKISGTIFVIGLFLLAIADQQKIITINYLAFAWIPASVFFLWKYFGLKDDPGKIADLANWAIAIVLTAPLIFI